MKVYQLGLVLGVVLTLTLLSGPLAALAQRPAGVPEATLASLDRDARTFGPTQSTILTISSYQFVGLTPGDNNVLTGLTGSSFGSRFCNGASCLAEAGVVLPEGALVTSIQLEACDVFGGSDVVASLFKTGPSESAQVLLAQASTSGLPGCTRVSTTLPTAHTIDNLANTYTMQVSMGGTGGMTRFQAVRVFYNLQVSPAPATARFNDVPTSHPFFQFVEALAEAGITGGCSTAPPLYCPDNFVTRGQMAVFISKALGLQFAP